MRIKACEECGYRKTVKWDEYFKSFLCDSCWSYLTDKEEKEKD